MNAQSKIIFSRSPGALNTGKTLDVMMHDLITNKTILIYKGTVKKRGEYSAVTSPNNTKVIFNTYQFGGWKLGIADIHNNKLTNVKK